MASFALEPAQVELHEPEIAKPQPLRIIKRSKTVAGCEASGEDTGRGGDGISSSSYRSKGSPPFGADRPLTVHKMRKGRGSVLNGSFNEVPQVSSSGNAISDLIKKSSKSTSVQDDPDLTPKAGRAIPRAASAGAFLRSEIHQYGLGDDVDRCSSSGWWYSSSSSNSYEQGSDESMRVPERRFTKSKNFLMKAISKHSSVGSMPPPRIGSNSSKNTFIRCLSMGRSRSSASAPDCSENAGSSGSLEAKFSDQPESQDITDVNVNSFSSGNTTLFSSASDSLSNVLAKEVLLLSPQIIVTPELATVPGGTCSLWVAVEITGVLQRANGHEFHDGRLQKCDSQSGNANISDLRQHGRLNAMRVELLPGQGCMVSEIIGTLYESRTMRAGQTHLILVKVRMSPITTLSAQIQESSDDLIADLENELGSILTTYLTVRLTYKHSGFGNYNTTNGNLKSGMSSHTTILQTEATAVIRRHNPQSNWSTITSQNLSAPLGINPLLQLIETYLPADVARQARQKLADERIPIPLARRSNNISWNEDQGPSPECAMNVERRSSEADSAISVSMDHSSVEEEERVEGRPQQNHGAKTQSSTMPRGTGKEKALAEIDPARKIWSEMRRTSRGSHRPHQRTSILNANHLISGVDGGPSSPQLNPPPANNNASSYSGGWAGLGAAVPKRNGIEEQRNQIIEAALRNKRSLGADTLRSIAPSIIANSVVAAKEGKAGTFGGGPASLGLGVGRTTWGWGPPWW